MPTLLVGRKDDRMHRASDFNGDRKGRRRRQDLHNLIARCRGDVSEMEKEASETIANLERILPDAKELPDKVLDRNPKDFTSGNVIQANMDAILVQSKLNEAKYMYALALAGLERATVGAFRVYPIPAAALQPAEPMKK